MILAALAERRSTSPTLVAAVGLILGIKRLSLAGDRALGEHHRRGRDDDRGRLHAPRPEIDSYWLIVVGIAVGTVIGVVSARLVKMTAMPQMVALFNGVGGGAAALIAAAEFHRLAPASGTSLPEHMGAILFSALIGSISFSGSRSSRSRSCRSSCPGGRSSSRASRSSTRSSSSRSSASAILAGATEAGVWMVVLLLGALLFGVLLVLPIGGADMPVVISFLNAFTGLAAASTGFVLENTALIIGGTLVGASGTLLTILMGRAMNRSLANVLFGAFGAAAPARWQPRRPAGGDGEELPRDLRPRTAPSCSPTRAR